MLLFVVVAWGGNFVVLKLAFEGIDRDVFNAARYGVAAVVSLPLLVLPLLGSGGEPADAVGRPTARGGRWRLPARAWRPVLVAALVGNVAYQWVFAAGVDGTTAGKSAVILCTSPLWVAVFARLSGERVAVRTWIGMLVALGGVAVLVADRTSGGTRAGDLTMVAGSVLWALYIVCSRPALAAAGDRLTHVWSMIIGAAGLGLVASLRLDAERLAPLLTPAGLFALAYAGVLTIGLCFLLWSVAIRRAGPVHTSMFQSLVPVVALAVEAVVIPEAALAPRHWVAAIVVVAAVAFARGRRAKPSAD